MSRVGKHPVQIPASVKVHIAADAVEVKGPKGDLTMRIAPQVIVTEESGKLVIAPKDETKEARSLWGTTRILIANMIKGVSEGFVKVLEVQGVGFKVAMIGSTGMLRLTLGFSHDIIYMPPSGVKLQCPKPTQVEVHGTDKQLVGQVASELRAFRKPEPYKGKGVRYADEKIIRKVGKKKS